MTLAVFGSPDSALYSYCSQNFKRFWLSNIPTLSYLMKFIPETHRAH
jgi:hypothetical protein